jgi:hypothetical protein
VPEEQLPMEDLDTKEDLSYQEYPTKVLEMSERVTRNKGVFGWASTRDGTGSTLMSGMSSSHLMFGWMDEVIPIFCLVEGTRMRGMRIII